MSDFIFAAAHDRLGRMLEQPERVQILLLKSRWKKRRWFIRDRWVDALGTLSGMRTIDDLLVGNQEADFGGYQRKVLDVVSTRDGGDPYYGSLDAVDPAWHTTRPSNIIGWAVFADMKGNLLTSHPLGPIETDAPIWGAGSFALALHPQGFWGRTADVRRPGDA